MRVDDAAGSGPGMYGSPRHKMPLNPRGVGTKRVGWCGRQHPAGPTVILSLPSMLALPKSCTPFIGEYTR